MTVRRLQGRMLPALVLLMGLGATACGDGSSVGGDRALVVATTGIWGDVVANVACDPSIEIEVLIPDGADVHSFEPSLADRALLDDAALVVANGLLLEEGLLDPIDAVESAGVPVFRFGDHVETLDYQSTEIAGEDHVDEESADDHGHESAVDPHIWFDPTRVVAALPALADALVDEVGLDPATVDDCLDDYSAELTELDREIVDLVSAVPAESRRLVTSHDALGYFADRYGFEIVATVSPSPSGLAETNPARLEELVDAMERTGVRVVFADAQSASDDAEALARRVEGAEVVVLPTGTLGPAGEGADTYVALVRYVAEAIVAALGG